MRTAVIKSISDTVDKFVVCKGRSAGNTAALQQIVKEGCRKFDMKKELSSARIGGVEQHLALLPYHPELHARNGQGRY